MNHTFLKNAPIAESILQIRFENSDDILNRYELFYNAIISDFNSKNERYTFSKTFKLEEDKESNYLQNETFKKLDSILFFNEDNTKSIIISNDYYSFHFINKYSNWMEFKKLSEKYWDIFNSIYDLKIIPKISLRYINKIKLNLPVKFEDYFNVSNMGGDSLEYDLYDFFTKYLIYSKKYDSFANIVLAKDNSYNENDKFEIVLDIDAFKELEVNHNIWELFEHLRGLQNEVFFNVLTERTIKLFE